MLARLFPVLICGVIGAGVGWFFDPFAPRSSKTETMVPEPYLTPLHPDGMSLSLAMVHDVVHERYVRPGKAWYAERNRVLLAELPAADAAPPDDLLPHLGKLNDLAIGQFYTGQTQESLATLDRKQALQQEVDKLWQEDKVQRTMGAPSWSKGDPARLELYRTYANRGTILILDALTAGLHDNPTAQEELRVGTEIIREAVLMNSDSHFGREPWQLVILEFLLAVCREPKLLLEFDMVGDRLDAKLTESASTHVAGWPDRWQALPAAERTMMTLTSANPTTEIQRFRDEVRAKWIARLGAESGWTDKVDTIHKGPVPFDEPTLAIVGMWMIGGGPNPHFAIALGEMMQRVGQYELAWHAFRRAETMANFVWPDEEIREGFIGHCQRRRTAIESLLASASEPAQQIRARFETEFDEELARGQAYQKAYHAFEEERIAQGTSLEDKDFFKPIYEKQGRIASSADGFDVIKAERPAESKRNQLPVMLLFAGLFALPASVFVAMRGNAPRTKVDSTRIG